MRIVLLLGLLFLYGPTHAQPQPTMEQLLGTPIMRHKITWQPVPSRVESDVPLDLVAYHVYWCLGGIEMGAPRPGRDICHGPVLCAEGGQLERTRVDAPTVDAWIEYPARSGSTHVRVRSEYSGKRFSCLSKPLIITTPDPNLVPPDGLSILESVYIHS